MTNHREILRLHSQGFSHRSIAASCECGKGTVQRTIRHAKEQGLTWPLPPELTNERLKKMFASENAPEGSKVESTYKEPDYEHIHKEMNKNGVTLSLLWNEYCAACRQEGSMAYKYSAFCSHYRSYTLRTKATMHMERKPGEQMEVDWAGQTMSIADNITGEIIPVYIFVSVLSYSGYAYVEAFLNRTQGSWITAHINAYSYYGGVTKTIVPDNLKTGVTKRTKSDIILNSAYQEMEEHYDTVILPARVRKPKDKPSVESAVGHVST